MSVHFKLKIYCVLNLILSEISEDKRTMVFMLLPCFPGYSKRWRWSAIPNRRSRLELRVFSNFPQLWRTCSVQIMTEGRWGNVEGHLSTRWHHFHLQSTTGQYLNLNIQFNFALLTTDALMPRRLPQIWQLWCVMICLSRGVGSMLCFHAIWRKMFRALKMIQISIDPPLSLLSRAYLKSGFSCTYKIKHLRRP